MDYAALGQVIGIVLLVLIPVAAFAIYLGLLRWMWKQRGIGFARGWFEVQAEHDWQEARKEAALVYDAIDRKSPGTSPPSPQVKPDGSGEKTADAGHRWLR